MASEADVLVLSGRCYESKQVPYKAFDSLIRPRFAGWLEVQTDFEVQAALPLEVAELVRVFPVLLKLPLIAHTPGFRQSNRPPRAEEAREPRSARAVSASGARGHHVVLFIDDVHWADEESARLLEDLLATPDAPRVLLLVVSHRGDEAGTLLMQVLDRLSPLRMLEVSELSDVEAKALAGRLLASHPDAIAPVVSECGGHPYLLVEIGDTPARKSKHGAGCRWRKRCGAGYAAARAGAKRCWRCSPSPDIRWIAKSPWWRRVRQLARWQCCATRHLTRSAARPTG